MLTQSQATKVFKALAHHDKYRAAYFWAPPPIASARRKVEREGTLDVAFTHKGVRYEYHAHVDCSARHVRYTGAFLVEGRQRTVRSFKALVAPPAKPKAPTPVPSAPLLAEAYDPADFNGPWLKFCQACVMADENIAALVVSWRPVADLDGACFCCNQPYETSA